MKDGVRALYTLEFKQEAVRLVRGGEKLSAVARTLGVSAQSLDNWVKAELSRVRMERDILKNRHRLSPPVRGRNWSWYGDVRRVAADCLLVV